MIPDPACTAVGSALTQREGGAESHTLGLTGTEKQEQQSLKTPLRDYILQQSFSVRIARLEPV